VPRDLVIQQPDRFGPALHGAPLAPVTAMPNDLGHRPLRPPSAVGVGRTVVDDDHQGRHQAVGQAAFTVAAMRSCSFLGRDDDGHAITRRVLNRCIDAIVVPRGFPGGR